jgi:hypothetical protein
MEKLAERVAACLHGGLMGHASAAPEGFLAGPLEGVTLNVTAIAEAAAEIVLAALTPQDWVEGALASGGLEQAGWECFVRGEDFSPGRHHRVEDYRSNAGVAVVQSLVIQRACLDSHPVYRVAGHAPSSPTDTDESEAS